MILFGKLGELKVRKEELEDELKAVEKGKLEGPEERERLLKKVKEDNQDIHGMERKIIELDGMDRKLKEELSAADVSDPPAAEGKYSPKPAFFIN